MRIALTNRHMRIKAKKVNMSQIFTDEGLALPVTLLALEKGEDLSNLTEGVPVSVSGISKGKGFQGVVKRHGFKGGPRTHGQKHSEREPGSIGIGGVQKVMKGMRMAGRMGSEKVTIKNLRIAKVNPETQEVYVVGAIPGRRGSKVEIRLK
jgi:large subunit ribosomal protein L3